MMVVARGSNEATLETKRSEAENLRGRFINCNEGLAMARGLRDVAERDPGTRNSSYLSPQLRVLLVNIELGHLTAPEATPQCPRMYALCGNEKRSTEAS